MNYYTYNLFSEKELEKVLEIYNDYKVSLEPYVLYIISKEKFIIKIYKSLKMLFIGNDFFLDIDLLDQKLNRYVGNQIGSDEVGNGDLFGPLVVVSAYINLNDLKLLRSLGVKDSKLLKDEEIIKIATVLLNEHKIIHSALILDNELYNEVNKTYNLNQIKAKMHNQALLKTKEKVKDSLNTRIVLDQFCDPKLYYKYLSEEKVVLNDIVFETKAESKYLSVALASIIARYIFLNKFAELEKKYDVKLLKGCSNDTKKIYFNLLEKKPELLRKIAKLNFKFKKE